MPRNAGDAAGPRERLIPLRRSRGSDREVTIYVKGFLGRGEKPDHFEDWLESHRDLEDSHGWGRRAHGWSWESGNLERLALPAAATAKIAYDLYRKTRRAQRIALFGALGVAAAEQIVRLSVRLVQQYLGAAHTAHSRAEHLARRFEALAQRYEHVRVVAHSLGCVQVIEAASLVEPWQRPTEIHLCAPACRERDVREKLDRVAQRRTYLYFTRKDLVLESAFRLMARGRALGAIGPRHEYPGLVSTDVGEHFGLRVHGDYKRRLPRFAGKTRRSALTRKTQR